MKKKVLILAGDGIGPEVTQQAVRVLSAVADTFDITIEYDHALIGHSAIEASGQALPQETLNKALDSDAILLGAVGHPVYDNNPKAQVRPEQGLLKIRKELELFSNIRPIKIFDQLIHSSSLKPEVLAGADILFYRELTSGIYFGEPRERRENGNAAVDTLYYHKEEVSRIVHAAFKAARSRSRRLHSVDKANVLESSRLWRETVQEIAVEYPDVDLTHMFIDNAAMQLIRDPRQFDVVVTTNMFGDILTDEASQIAGSLGMLASASVGKRTGLYEPVHGSAPDIAGQDIANPIATILSVALMFEIAFENSEAGKLIFNSVEKFLEDGFRTRDIASQDTDREKIFGCKACGDEIIKNINVLKPTIINAITTI